MVMLSRLLLTQHKRFVPQGTHPNRASFGLENRIYINDSRATSDNTAYTLRANALALRDIPTSSGRRICWNRYLPLRIGGKAMNNDLEYMREIYRFLPPGVDPGLDFTPLIFCDSYEKFRSEVWFYEEILEYGIIKQEDVKCLLWNGEEYVIIFVCSP